jgi:hypothetical protein
MSDLLDKFRTVLRACEGARSMAEIYTDEEDLDRFSVGYVEEVGRETYTLAAIDDEGRFDGRQVGRLEAIIKLTVDSEYLSALKLLHEGGSALEPTRPSGPPPRDLRAGLEAAMRDRTVASVIDVDHQAHTGFVTDVGEEFVEISEIRRDGHRDGMTILRLDDVFRVDIGGRTEQARGFLHRVRMGL